jgi:hypothetical protein
VEELRHLSIESLSQCGAPEGARFQTQARTEEWKGLETHSSRWWKPMLLICALSLFSVPALPCTYAYPDFNVSSAFSVKVFSPIRAGLTVVLEGPQKFQSQTDARGIARFNGIPDGEYEVKTAQSGGRNDLAFVHVNHSLKRSQTIALEYPVSPVVRSQNLRGNLRYGSSQLLVKAIRQPDGAELGQQPTIADGKFDFGRVPAGLYTLELRLFSREDDKLGTIPIQVKSSGPKSVDLSLSESTCGLGYVPSCKKDFTKLITTVPAACFVVQDQMGAVIPRAELTLTSTSSPATIVAGLSNSGGLIDFPQQIAGDFDLHLTASGFPDVKRKIRLGGMTCVRRVQIEMAFVGCTGKMKIVEAHATSN